MNQINLIALITPHVDNLQDWDHHREEIAIKIKPLGK